MTLYFYCIAVFFLGAVPTAYLAGRLFKNIDIRRHGSGNVGATNAFRVLGKGPGALVFALDFFKGALPVLLFGVFFSPSDHSEFFRLMAGLVAVVGHVYTPLLGFKGGKGIATGAGVLCAGYPHLFLITLGVWLATFFISKIVSLSSLVAVSMLAISGFLTVQNVAVKPVFLGMTCLVFWTHRSNITRLIRGEETSFGKTKK